MVPGRRSLTPSQEITPQLISYVNRFGPGAVIYWFGCAQSLNAVDRDILVLPGFPRGGRSALLAPS